MQNEPETFDLRELVGDIADALRDNRDLWPDYPKHKHAWPPKRDRFWRIATAVAERFQRGRYTIVMKPVTPMPASKGRAEGSEGWYQNLPKDNESPGHR